MVSEAFNYMFRFYSLLLGLAVAEVVAGFSRSYDERAVRPLGIVAPLFGLLLLVDLTTFWINAFAYRGLEEVRYVTALAVATVALLYYFAATQVFPKASKKDTLDDHIMGHRRVVVLCVLVSNLMTQIPPAMDAFGTPWPTEQIVLWASLNGLYYGLLAVAGLARSKRVVAASLAVAIVYVVGATVVFS
jgi:hypothetical protein